MNRAGKKGNVIVIIAGIIVCAVVAFVLAVVFCPIEVSVGENALTVHCLYFDETISYDNIAECTYSVDYKSDRILAFGGGSKDLGTYNNQSMGRHSRVSYAANSRAYIIVEKTDGTYLVFNLKTADATAKLYDSIAAKL